MIAKENVVLQAAYKGIHRDMIPREAVIVIDNIKKVDSSEILQNSLAVRQFDAKIENKLTKNGTVYFNALLLEDAVSGRKIYNPHNFKTLEMLQKSKF